MQTIFKIKVDILSDNSSVFDIVGENDEAIVKLHCVDEYQALRLKTIFNEIAGVTLASKK